MNQTAELSNYDGGGLLGSLAVSFVSLGVVCVLAYFALRFLARKQVGKPMGPLRIVARLPLDPRRSVYLIDAEGERFLVGAGEGHVSMLGRVNAVEGMDNKGRVMAMSDAKGSPGARDHEGNVK